MYRNKKRLPEIKLRLPCRFNTFTRARRTRCWASPPKVPTTSAFRGCLFSFAVSDATAMMLPLNASAAVLTLSDSTEAPFRGPQQTGRTFTSQKEQGIRQ